MKQEEGVSRRKFIKNSAAGAATLALAAGKAGASEREAPAHVRKLGTNDLINVGYIGVGVRGKQHMRFTGFLHPSDKAKGMEDPTANLPRKLNVRAHAACDVYEGNRKWAQEAGGPDTKVYLDFEEMLADDKLDAVFIGTSDHNHPHIGIPACNAGKAVYSEKCFAITLEEAKAYRDAIKKNNTIFSLGHQTRSGTLLDQARKALGGIGPEGSCGKLNLIETYTNRNTANAAWVYAIPTDASPETIDWKRFTGAGPKREFNTDRFFRWRKYWDYGMGLAADLLTHEMDGIQQVTGLGIPDTAVASGAICVWKDERETPDVMQVAYHYEPEELLVTYNATLGNGRGREKLFMGRDGYMDLTKGIKIVVDADSDRYAERIEKGEWTVPVADEEFVKARELVRSQTKDTSEWTIDKGILMDVVEGKIVNVTALHVLNWVECIREGTVKTNCDADAAFEEAVIAIMANEAYHRGRKVRWDRKRERIVNDAA